MKLSKISYGSAVFFGVSTFILYLILGIVQWTVRDQLAAMTGVAISARDTFLTAPLIGLVAGYVFVLLMIFIYNMVAKKFPIAWDVKK